MKVAVIYDSLTGNTKRASEMIAAAFRAEGHEASASSVGRLDLASIGSADLVVLGSWVHGAFVLGQAPALEIRQKIQGPMVPLGGKQAVVFCTYALAAGKSLEKMTSFAESFGMNVEGGMLIKRTNLQEGADTLVDRVLANLPNVGTSGSSQMVPQHA
jgi:flavodoxin